MKVCWIGLTVDRTQKKRGSGLSQTKAHKKKKEKIIAVPETCGTLSDGLTNNIIIYNYNIHY